jgi:Na+/proline symporter
MQIATADWIVLIGYMIAIAAIGIIVGLKVRDTEHYFLGKRAFGRWLMIGQSFGIGTHAEMPVSLAGAVYSMGFSGIWFQWKNLFATPFYWLFAPVFRRIRRTTVAELTEDRYGPWMGAIYTVFALCFFTINTASMLKGAGKVINQAAGGDIGVNAIVIAMTVIFVLYSFIGGLVAAAWTDLFQGVLIIALSFMLIPLGWTVVGGLSGMRTSLEPVYFSLATPEGVGAWMIAVLTLNGLIGIMAQPHMLAAVGTGRDEHTCRVGFFYGNFVKRVCTVGWAFVGLIAAALVAQDAFGVTELTDPEDAFGFACRHLLFPGALGLLIASVMAANMSTCSAFMVDSGALFTQGFYRQHLVRGRDDRHYLWVGRFSVFAIAMVGVLYALFLIDRVLYSFLLTETMASYVGISLVGGIVWSRANRWGALASLVTALTTNFVLYARMGERLDHWDPNVFNASFLTGIAALVAVSLWTSPEPTAAVNAFIGRLQTPSRANDISVTNDALDRQYFANPQPRSDTAAHGEQSLLVNLLQIRRAAVGIGVLKAYAVDLRGFAGGWLLVLLLVALTALLLRL